MIAAARTHRGLFLFTVVSGFLLACGARTEIDVDPAVTSPPDGSDDVGIDTASDVPVLPPAPCAADRECSRGVRCVADVPFLGEDLEGVPLVCGSLLPGASDGAFCDVASDCDRGLCVVAGTCVPPCIDDDDCAGVMRCRPVYARTGARSLQPYRGCVALHDAPAGVAVESEIIEGALGSRDRELVLRKLDTTGPTTWVVAPSPDIEAFPRRLTGPLGEVLYDERAVDFGAPAPINTVAFGAPVSILLPNSPRDVPAGRDYTLLAGADERTDVVLTSFGVDGSRRRVLDIDLYYVGGMGWAPSGMRGPPMVAEGLADAARLLGLRIGEIRQHEIVGGMRFALAILEEGLDFDLPELPELFRLSAGAGRASIDIFFVREAGLALGISGGIPGPAPMHGLNGSGIAIAADLLAAPGAPTLGRALAHELGHHLGLFHTSELLGIIIEPIADTPECRLDRDSDGDGFVTEEECVGAGADNLMFWAASGDLLTPDQGLVLHRSPVLR